VGLQLKYDVPECEERGMTYAAPLKVTIRLTVSTRTPKPGVRTCGTSRSRSLLRRVPADDRERNVHHQRHRARDRQPVAPLSGVFFEKVAAQGYYLGKIIPYRGSWVEFEYDTKNLLFVRIDRNGSSTVRCSCGPWA